MKPTSNTWCGTFLLVSAFAALWVPAPTRADVIMDWNAKADDDEVSLARIYAGFHYRFSTEVGKEMGKKIGELTIATKMRPVEATAAQPH
jgi:hypothetical protein